MNPSVPVIEGKKPTGEQDRLIAFFDEIEKKQLDFLNEAGKRIIELSTTLLGLLFAITAFGDKFPPAYLQGKGFAQGLVVLTLLLLIAASGAGLKAIQPRKFTRRAGNMVEEMQDTLEKALDQKSSWFRVGSWLFGLGSASLAVLVAAVIYGW